MVGTFKKSNAKDAKWLINTSARLVSLLGIFLLCFYAALAQDFAAVPQLSTPVTDIADILTPAQENVLTKELAAYEQQKGSQIAVVIVPTTAPEAIEQYSMRLAEAWKIGRKGVNDGVILLVAINDRALRIEVGYGLEGAIPDAIAKRIIEEQIVPQFRTKHFFEGIQSGIGAIQKSIDGEPLPPPAPWSSGEDNPSYILLLGMGVGLGLVLNLFMKDWKASTLSAIIVFFVGLWFYSELLSFFYAILTWFLSYGAQNGKGGGGYSVGRGGYSSSGGGSWSGGGGSFGGGGASGRW